MSRRCASHVAAAPARTPPLPLLACKRRSAFHFHLAQTPPPTITVTYVSFAFRAFRDVLRRHVPLISSRRHLRLLLSPMCARLSIFAER